MNLNVDKQHETYNFSSHKKNYKILKYHCLKIRLTKKQWKCNRNLFIYSEYNYESMLNI